MRSASVLILATLWLGQSAFGAGADSRLPVPDAAAFAKAQADLEKNFGKDLFHPVPAEQAHVAQTLLDAAMEPQANAAERYVLLTEVSKLACSGGAVQIAIAASRDLSTFYAVDEKKLRLDTLAQVALTATGAQAGRDIAFAATRLADRFAADDDWASLARLSTIADSAARQADSADLLAQTREHFQSLHELHLASEQMTSASRALAANPNDAKANTLAGLHVCLANGEWARGLAMLARSDDPALAHLAERDLSAPATSFLREQLASDWLEFAGKTPDRPTRMVALERAAHWYQLAETGALTLKKLLLAKRLKACRKELEAVQAESPTFAAPEAVRVSGGRDRIESAALVPFPDDQIKSDTSIPIGAGPYQIAKTLNVAGKLTFAPGAEVRGGTIDLGGKGHLIALGEPAKPIVFRDVTFVQDLGASLEAADAVFDHCLFRKGGVWFSYYSSKWKLTRCILYQCKFARLTGVDYGIQFQNCLFASMDFPEIQHKTENVAHLRIEWNKIVGCEFVDCAIPPAFFWCSEECNYEGCRFVPGKTPFDSDKPLGVNAFVDNTMGVAPDAAWNDDAKGHVTISDPAEPYATITVSDAVPVPEIIAGEPIRVASPHLKEKASQ